MGSTNTSVNSLSQDVIAILNGEDFTQLFPLASPMQVTVRELSKVLSFTVEDGSERSDHIVYLPVEIDIPFLLTEDTRNIYAAFKRAWKTQTTLVVQTKVDSFPNMLIYEMPHDENSEQGESITLLVKMRVFESIKTEFGALPPRKVANKSQGSTVKKGQVQTTESTAPTKRKASVLAGVFGT
jgi:hypothetical protein